LDEAKRPYPANGALTILTDDLLRIGNILGILQQPWQAFFEKRTQNQLQDMGIDPETIDALVAERAAARKRRDWKRADEIRETLEKAGILLEDKADGTRWKVAT
jgi:cysteinyl-tRNA synthetase